MTQPCWQTIGMRGDRSCPELASLRHCKYCPVYAEGARSSLRRPVAPGYLDARAAELAAPLAPPPLHDAAMLVFRCGGAWLGIAPELVRAVLPAAQPQRLPHRRAPGLLGVVQGDGLLYPAVGLVPLFGLEPDAAPLPGRHSFARLLLVQAPGQDVAIPVDHVEGVLRFAAAALAPPERPYLSGTLAHQGRQIGRLDSQRLLAQLQELLR